MMTLKNVPSVPIGSSSRRAPKIVSEGHNNGNRRRRRCISATYRDTGFRKRGMSILQAPPRATSKGGNGEWWPESPRWRAGRPPAGRVTYFFSDSHACPKAQSCMPKGLKYTCRHVRVNQMSGVPHSQDGHIQPTWSWHIVCAPSVPQKGSQGRPECTRRLMHACQRV